MVIWVIFIVIALLLTYLASNSSSIGLQKEPYIILLSLWLGWFVSFGGKAMQDQYSYFMLFNYAKNTPIYGLIDFFKSYSYSLLYQRETFEIGYVVLNIIFAKLNFGYLGFIFIFSFVSNFLLVKFLLRYDNSIFAIIILIGSSLYSQQANAVRQMMVVSMFAYSIKYIENKKILKYFFMVFLGSTLHMSALILLPLYFFINKEFPKWLLLIIWFGSILINRLMINFDFIQNINIIYYDISELKFGRPEELVFDPVKNIFVLFCIIFFDYNNKLFPKFRIIYNLFILGVVFLNLVSVSYYFYRLSLYFYFFSIAIIPMIPVFIKMNNKLRKNNLNNLFYHPAYVIITLWYLKILTNRVTETSTTLGTSFYSFNEFFQ